MPLRTQLGKTTFEIVMLGHFVSTVGYSKRTFLRWHNGGKLSFQLFWDTYVFTQKKASCIIELPELPTLLLLIFRENALKLCAIVINTLYKQTVRINFHNFCEIDWFSSKLHSKLFSRIFQKNRVEITQIYCHHFVSKSPWNHLFTK